MTKLTLLYEIAQKKCPQALISTELTSTNTEVFFFDKLKLLEYFQNDSYIRNYLISIVPNSRDSRDIAAIDILRFFENIKDVNPRGRGQIYCPWLLALKICEKNKLNELVSPTFNYKKKVVLRIASRYMYYFEQRIRNDPMFVNVLDDIFVNYDREFHYKTITGKSYYMDGAFTFKNRIFLEIQENQANHSDQPVDEEKKSVILAGGDEVVYFRIGVLDPEDDSIHRTHFRFYNKILREKIIDGLIQTSEKFRVEYCKNEFRQSIQNEITHCLTKEQTTHREFLESELNEESEIFKEIMKYSSEQIFAKPPTGYVATTQPCVPIINLLKNTRTKMTIEFMKYSQDILNELPHMKTVDGTILLSFRLSVTFLLRCLEFVETSHIEYIIMYLSSVQPIYNDMIKRVVDKFNMRCELILKHKDHAYACLKKRLENQHKRVFDKMTLRCDETVNSYKKLLQTQTWSYEREMRKHNLTMDSKVLIVSDLEVVMKENLLPGEPIISGIEDFPLIKRRDSDPVDNVDTDFVTNKDVLKILETITTKPIAKILAKKINEQYKIDTGNILPDIYLLRDCIIVDDDGDSSDSDLLGDVGDVGDSEYDTSDDELDELIMNNL
jgi:hypothetical protein